MISTRERIKQVRASASLTQDAFAEKMNISKNYVCLLENGKKQPSDNLIKLMCIEYGINEHWLRTGEGDMFEVLTEDAELAKWIGEIQFNAVQKERVALIKKRLLVALSHIKSDEAWIAWEQAIDEIAASKRNSEE